MTKKGISVERIKKAQLRYFDKEHNGVEVPDFKAYTIFIKLEDTYMNLFNGLEELNVYERLPYSNSTQSGEDFGTKIRLVCGKEENGVCYVLETTDMEELKGLDSVTETDLYKIVLDSEDFYFDRIDLLNAYPHMVGFIERMKIMKKDKPMRDKLFKYLGSKEKEKVMKKFQK